MKRPYAWHPSVIDTQLLRIGDFGKYIPTLPCKLVMVNGETKVSLEKPNNSTVLHTMNDFPSQKSMINVQYTAVVNSKYIFQSWLPCPGSSPSCPAAG